MFILSRAFLQGFVTGRDANGDATKRDAKHIVIAPKLCAYGDGKGGPFPWELREGISLGKNWVVCIVPDTFQIPALTLTALQADVDILIPPVNQKIALDLTSRTAFDTKLALTDLGVSTSSGESVEDVTDRIVKVVFAQPIGVKP